MKDLDELSVEGEFIGKNKAERAGLDMIPETVRQLESDLAASGRDYFTVADIRAARAKVYGYEG